MTPLEPFSRVNRRREGIPTPFPTAGNPCGLGSAFVAKGFAGVHPWDCIPDFGRFLSPTALEVAGSRVSQKPPFPPVAHATNGFTHGRVEKNYAKFFRSLPDEEHAWILTRENFERSGRTAFPSSFRKGSQLYRCARFRPPMGSAFGLLWLWNGIMWLYSVRQPS
jgi:hypothetical protein